MLLLLGKYVERIKREKMRGRDRDASIERPSWGFGNSRVPSRQEVAFDDYAGGGRTSRSQSRAPSRFVYPVMYIIILSIQLMYFVLGLPAGQTFMLPQD